MVRGVAADGGVSPYVMHFHAADLPLVAKGH